MALSCNRLLLKENSLQSRKPSLSNVILQSPGSQCFLYRSDSFATRNKSKKKIKEEVKFKVKLWWGFPGGSVIKKSTHKAGDTSSIPGPGKPPGEGSGNPLRYSCLGNPTDKGDFQATVHEVTKSWIWLSNQTTTRQRCVEGAQPWENWKDQDSYKTSKMSW